MYYISSHDFGAIQTTRVDIYIFTTETPYKISSRTLLPPSLRTGKFTVECPCPEAFRQGPSATIESVPAAEYREWPLHGFLKSTKIGNESTTRLSILSFI